MRDATGAFTSVDVPGAIDTELTAVNDAGQAGGFAVGTLFVVPEPSSVLLLGIGFVGLMGYTLRHRKAAP